MFCQKQCCASSSVGQLDSTSSHRSSDWLWLLLKKPRKQQRLWCLWDTPEISQEDLLNWISYVYNVNVYTWPLILQCAGEEEGIFCNSSLNHFTFLSQGETNCTYLCVVPIGEVSESNSNVAIYAVEVESSARWRLLYLFWEKLADIVQTLILYIWENLASAMNRFLFFFQNNFWKLYTPLAVAE